MTEQLLNRCLSLRGIGSALLGVHSLSCLLLIENFLQLKEPECLSSVHVATSPCATLPRHHSRASEVNLTSVNKTVAEQVRGRFERVLCWVLYGSEVNTYILIQL